jgi:hypothetical protein
MIIVPSGYNTALIKVPTSPEPTSNASSSGWRIRADFQASAGESYIVQFDGGQDYLVYDLSVWPGHQEHELLARTLLENVRARTLEGYGTTPPSRVRLTWDNLRRPARSRFLRAAKSTLGSRAAKLLLKEIRDMSGLTLEEIAPLVGVTRRSIHHWRADRPISARKEQRLRAIRDTLDALAGKSADEIRAMLLERLPGSMRPYDLIAEGHFDVAFKLLTGRVAPESLSSSVSKRTPPPGISVLDRLSARHDDPNPIGKLDLRHSGRVKR